MSASDMTGVPDTHPAAGVAGAKRVRPFYWSVRRELWENRSVTIAPLAVTALVLLGSLAGIVSIARKAGTYSSIDAAYSLLLKPFSIAPAPIMFACFVIGAFYSLDALHGERRDRSILFWRSLPVSDRTTVLAKAVIPLAVLPSIAFVLSVTVQLVMLAASLLVLPANGLSFLMFFSRFRFFEGIPVMVYGLAVHTLWFAPIYAFLLFVSAWARRAPVLWAILPVLALSAFERLALGTTHVVGWLQSRVSGAMQVAFTVESRARGDFERVWDLTPVDFLTAPGLWTGLVFAAVFVGGAVHVRRSREPG